MNDLFSERYGYVTKALQYERLDSVVRNHIWDEIAVFFLNRAKSMYAADDLYYDKDEECVHHAFNFYYSIQRDFWGDSGDDFPEDVAHTNKQIKNLVLHSGWFHVFDLIEALVRFCPELIPDKKERKDFLKRFYVSLNEVFIEEKCSYRIVNGLIVPNVNNAEIITIAEALTDTVSIKTVNTHLEQAVKHYSDRKNPDYRNSIKEAILALESLLKLIAGKEKGTLDDAIKAISKNNTILIHSALQTSIKSLYGWAGDESGIRHSLKSDNKIATDDAKLIIVTCCSLVSYLLTKANQGGIKLS